MSFSTLTNKKYKGYNAIVDNNHPIDTITGEKISEKKLRRELRSFESRLAQIITDFAGSMQFVYFHMVWFGIWILINQGYLAHLFGLEPFDPFPYGLLTMIVSLEAIFLSTFIMVAQNRQAIIDTVRELEEEKEEQAQEEDFEEVQEDIEEVQEDLDEIKKAITLISDKVISLEKIQNRSHPKK